MKTTKYLAIVAGLALIGVAAVTQYGPLQYERTTMLLSPSNALSSNILAGANITITKGAASQLTIAASASGGSTITNALLSSGPTNGSVGAKILTATSGDVTLTTVNVTNINLALARPLLDPFVVIDNVAYYPTNPWKCLINEEFIGDPTLTSVSQFSETVWNVQSTAGTIDRLAPLAESGAIGYLSINTTNAGVATTYIAGPGTGTTLLLTNVELVWIARWRTTSTNTTANSIATRVGLSSSVTTTEPANGFWIRSNTNATNNLNLGTARASSRTITFNTHASNVYDNFTWTTVGGWLDSTGTNAYGLIGHSQTNLTKFATNNSNIPDSVLVAPVFTTDRIVGNGATRWTNYLDRFQLWVRYLNANN